MYSTRRLIEAAKKLGHRPFVLDTLKCHLVVEKGEPQVWFGGELVPAPHVLLPRIGASITAYGLAVVTQFECMQVPVVNRAASIAKSRDKLHCLQVLARAGIAVPKTLLAHHRASVPMLIEQVGGLPAIVKFVQGTQGVGVMIATTLEEAEALLNTFWDLGHDILLQQFIQESRGRDIRALVVGDRVAAAMVRQAKEGEFRSNMHRGAQGSPITLSDAQKKAAIQASRTLGLEIAGVDLFDANGGPMVVEVNSSPGFEGLESVTQTDIAREIVRHGMSLSA